MDLSKEFDTASAAESGAFLHLEHPTTGEKLYDGDTAVGITLRGQDSRTFRQASHDISNKRMERQVKKLTAEALERNTRELLAACTVDWQCIEMNGEPLKCTRENADRLYAELPWIREQVDAFVSNRANFTGKSKKS